MSLSESAQPQQRGLVTKGGKKASTCNEENELSLDIDEADIEEQFIRGSGPGGQKINKSSVCVVSWQDKKKKKSGHFMNASN